jgi:hypothetical protein
MQTQESCEGQLHVHREMSRKGCDPGPFLWTEQTFQMQELLFLPDLLEKARVYIPSQAIQADLKLLSSRFRTSPDVEKSVPAIPLFLLPKSARSRQRGVEETSHQLFFVATRVQNQPFSEDPLCSSGLVCSSASDCVFPA